MCVAVTITMTKPDGHEGHRRDAAAVNRGEALRVGRDERGLHPCALVGAGRTSNHGSWRSSRPSRPSRSAVHEDRLEEMTSKPPLGMGCRAAAVATASRNAISSSKISSVERDESVEVVGDDGDVADTTYKDHGLPPWHQLETPGAFEQEGDRRCRDLGRLATVEAPAVAQRLPGARGQQHLHDRGDASDAPAIECRRFTADAPTLRRRQQLASDGGDLTQGRPLSTCPRPTGGQWSYYCRRPLTGRWRCRRSR